MWRESETNAECGAQKGVACSHTLSLTDLLSLCETARAALRRDSGEGGGWGREAGGAAGRRGVGEVEDARGRCCCCCDLLRGERLRGGGDGRAAPAADAPSASAAAAAAARRCGGGAARICSLGLPCQKRTRHEHTAAHWAGVSHSPASSSPQAAEASFAFSCLIHGHNSPQLLQRP
jgi:hypothetical protein